MDNINEEKQLLNNENKSTLIGKINDEPNLEHNTNVENTNKLFGDFINDITNDIVNNNELKNNTNEIESICLNNNDSPKSSNFINTSRVWTTSDEIDKIVENQINNQITIENKKQYEEIDTLSINDKNLYSFYTKSNQNDIDYWIKDNRILKEMTKMIVDDNKMSEPERLIYHCIHTILNRSFNMLSDCNNEEIKNLRIAFAKVIYFYGRNRFLSLFKSLLTTNSGSMSDLIIQLVDSIFDVIQKQYFNEKKTTNTDIKQNSHNTEQIQKKNLTQTPNSLKGFTPILNKKRQHSMVEIENTENDTDLTDISSIYLSKRTRSNKDDTELNTINKNEEEELEEQNLNSEPKQKTNNLN